MIKIKIPPLNFKMRSLLLLCSCLIFLCWNMALSTRRKYYSGKIVTVKQEDVVLKISCSGKIEPKVQETIHAIVEGNKKEVHVKEGDLVKQGQLLMEISDQKIKWSSIKRRRRFKTPGPIIPKL